VQAVGVAV